MQAVETFLPVDLNLPPGPLWRSKVNFIGDMLMLRERLTRAQWNVFESTADAICDGVLDRLPVDHPEMGGLGQPL